VTRKFLGLNGNSSKMAKATVSNFANMVPRKVPIEPPDLREEGCHRGSRMVPFEIALVSCYRPCPSILTFLVSLRVSEI